MTVIAPKRVLKVPLKIYSLAANGYEQRDSYITSPKSQIGTWHKKMLEAQNPGRRLGTFAELFLAGQYLQTARPEEEADFVNGPSEWTGTVLDYENEHLLEGITLNPDGSIKNATIKLGKKEGVQLPGKSAYVKDLDDRYMPFASHLWGVQNPKRELPDYTYLWISPGFRPVVRGDWDRRDCGRVGADADYVASDGGFASRFVSDAKPGNVIMPQDYSVLTAKFGAKEAELRARMEAELQPLKNKLDAAVVLIE